MTDDRCEMRVALSCIALMALTFATRTATRAATQDDQPIQITRSEEGFLVSENGQAVFFYQLAPKSLNGEYERSNYIHPLHDLDGGVLTEDFPADHLHQRGIFWAWHQVFVQGKRVSDQWTTENSIWEVVDTEIVRAGSESAAVKVEFHWKSPKWLDASGKQKAFVEETAVVRVHRAEQDIRKIDFDIRLVALEDGVRIGGSEDDKGYGGFSARVRMPSDISFTGRAGKLIPQTMQIEAGPWVDFSGSYDSSARKSGVAILVHPSTANFPQPWILRAQRSMQNPVYPGNQAVPLPLGKPLILRYRMVIHRGDASRVDLNQLQAAYEKDPLPRY